MSIQGSVVATTDIAGGVRHRWEYEPFGFRWQTAGSQPDDTERGYTGHEHLDAVDLIHMNGRVQDPVLGRFISADPFVQAPYNAESLNRYSYVRNNPTSLVDPSGFQPGPGEGLESTPIGPFWSPAHLPDICLGGNPACDAQYSVDPSIIDDIFAASGIYMPGAGSVVAPTGFGAGVGVSTGAWTNDGSYVEYVPGLYELVFEKQDPFGVLEPFLFVLGPEWESHLVVHNADGSAFIDNYLGEVNWEAVILPVRALRAGVAARGTTTVYRSLNAAGDVQYAGITNNLARRAAEHLRGSGIQMEKLMGGLSRSDARAVEQALIEVHGLGRNGGTLLNRINSIARSNPAYADQLRRGYELLQTVGY